VRRPSSMYFAVFDGAELNITNGVLQRGRIFPHPAQEIKDIATVLQMDVGNNHVDMLFFQDTDCVSKILGHNHSMS
jgi:hypothetical protein